jgi:hypothetical protein
LHGKKALAAKPTHPRGPRPTPGKMLDGKPVIAFVASAVLDNQVSSERRREDMLVRKTHGVPLPFLQAEQALRHVAILLFTFIIHTFIVHTGAKIKRIFDSAPPILSSGWFRID